MQCEYKAGEKESSPNKCLRRDVESHERKSTYRKYMSYLDTSSSYQVRFSPICAFNRPEVRQYDTPSKFDVRVNLSGTGSSFKHCCAV